MQFNSVRFNGPYRKGAQQCAPTVLLLLLLVVPFAQSAVSNVYLAQSQSGTADGSSCANAKAVSFFNASANWGTGTGQIGPGTTAHLCGTFNAPAGASGYLQFQQGGTSGNPVTLYFEPGAALSAPYWGNGGAVGAAGVNYVVVDGGTNGTVQATANGTSLANQQDGLGLYFTSVSNSEVKNLTIANLYVRAGAGPDGANVYAMRWSYGSNIIFDHNTIHDTQTAFLYAFAPSAVSSNINLYGNTVYNINWGLIAGDGSANATLNGTLLIHDNDIHDFGLWDDNSGANGFHHDGIYWFTNFAGSSITGMQAFNNYIHGTNGTRTNAFIFWSDSGGLVQNSKVFNNLLVASDPVNSPANGFMHDWGQNDEVYNNTMIGPNTAQASSGFNGCISLNPGIGLTMRNNICSTVNGVLYMGPGATLTASDNNNFYNASFIGRNNASVEYDTLGTWQGCHAGGCPAGSHDIASLGSNPNLNAADSPNAGSPAIGGAANLTGLNIPALDTDKAGIARPGSGAWDIGAYQSSGAPSSACDLSGDGAVTVVDVQREVNQALGASCVNDINKDGRCDVIDVQRVVNAALGGTCVAN